MGEGAGPDGSPGQRTACPSPEPGTPHPRGELPSPSGNHPLSGPDPWGALSFRALRRSRVLTILKGEMGQPRLVFWGCEMACCPKQERFPILETLD